MILQARANQVSELPIELHDRSVCQDDDGNIEITLNQHYAVYAMKLEDGRTWYLVHTDEINQNTLWWMPEELYAMFDSTMPSGWITKKYSSDNDNLYSAYSSLFTWEVEEGIIDGEQWALDRYMAQVKEDATFPTDDTIRSLNAPFNMDRERATRQLDLELHKKRGYEHPDRRT